MGNRLLGTDIAGKLSKALGAKFLPATLIKVTEGQRGATASAGTQPNERPFPCRGILDSSMTKRFEESLVKKSSGAALVLGDTITGGQIPASGDKFTIEGSTSEIIGTERDPDAATYILLLA